MELPGSEERKKFENTWMLDNLPRGEKIKIQESISQKNQHRKWKFIQKTYEIRRQRRLDRIVPSYWFCRNLVRRNEKDTDSQCSRIYKFVTKLE